MSNQTEMTKVLVVPDIHGNWKEALKFIKKNKDKVEKVVCLGDYVDDFDESLNGKVMIDGFRELTELAKKESEKFCLCIGNHDYAYIHGSRCSGFHEEYAVAYKAMFEDAKDYLNIAYEIQGVVYSHAGFGMWFCKILLDKIGKEQLEVEDVNKLYKSNPEFFDFIFVEGTTSDKTGDSKYQGPLWIRPKSLIHQLYYPVQAVGHTELVIGDNTKPLAVTPQGRQELLLLFDRPDHSGFTIFENLNNFLWITAEKKEEQE